MKEALAIDIGGTKISRALISEDYQIRSRRKLPTPATAVEIISTIESVIDEALTDNNGLAGIGIGVAGLVDFAAGNIVSTPNLPAIGRALMDHLHSRFSLPIQIDNDANLAVLGELRCGAGRNRRNFIGLTVGTGLGGGIIINGELWRGSKGSAAEFGHMLVDPNGSECGCGNIGCLETKASGTAIERLAKEVVVAKPQSTLSRSVGGDPEIITGPTVAQAARAGDPEAVAVLTEVGRWLGIGIGNLINAFDPEIIILGGGVAQELDLVMKAIESEINRIVIDPRSRNLPVAISQLENNAGLLGAAALVLNI